MKLGRCEKGHFYDQDKYGVNCPYCAQMQQTKAEEPVNVVQPEETLAAVQVKEEVLPKEPVTQAEEVLPKETIPQVKEIVLPKEQEKRCEPVVGWLVCIEGVYKGEGFKLKVGRNFIGREEDMDIVLQEDKGVAARKHATVIYEPRKNKFIVSPGDVHELCYMNDEVILSNVDMQAYDVLNLGKSSLMLIPCCSERFTWEEGLKS